MNKDEFDLLNQFKREQISNGAIELYNGLQDRGIGYIRQNANSKEKIELFAEEGFVRKKDFSEMRCEMPGIPRSTFLMVFSPDGTKVASTHGNHNIYITDLRNGRNIKTLIGHPRTPWCIAFHPTSDQIVASGCLGGQVRIWDLSGGSEVWTAVNQSVIASLSFHPNDRVLAIATCNCVYFWDWSKPEPFVSAATYNHKEKVRYVAFDTLGHKLITGIANSPMTRWERVRAPVPVPRQEWCASPYRRRITQRLANVNQNQSSNSDNSANTNRESLLSFPERERRISMCYRTLVREYEQLVHRYLHLYRTPTMIDRGTDPMEPHLWFNNSGTQTSETLTCVGDKSETPQPSTSGTSDMSQASTSDTTNISQPSTSGTTANQLTISAADRVLEEVLPGSSKSLPNKQIKKSTPEESLPSTSSQFPQKSAHNLLTPSRIFSVIKKPNTLIRGTQTSESRKHRTDDSDEPKEKRLKKSSDGNKSKSSRKSSKDGKTNSTQTEQAPTVRKVVPINLEHELTNTGSSSLSSSNLSNFRIRSNQEDNTGAGPSGLSRQESTETEEEMIPEPGGSREPSTSRASSRRGEQFNQANVDDLLSNIKRTAEEEVRNRILPIIRSLPATDRPELIRLFENSREHVRMRFRQMYPNLMRKNYRRHSNLVDTTSDSSSSDEESNTHTQTFRRNSNNSRHSTNDSGNSNPCSELERLVVLLTDIEGSDRGAQTSRDRDSRINTADEINAIHNASNNTLSGSVASSSDNVLYPSSPAPDSTTILEQGRYYRRLMDRFRDVFTGQSSVRENSSRDVSFQHPAAVANTNTRTTNSTIYTSNTSAPRRRFFSHRISAFMPTRVNYIRHRRMPHYVLGRNRLVARPFTSSTFGVDELFNYSELDNSEDDPPPPPPPPDADHPEIPATSSEETPTEMCYNIVRELESCLENVLRMRVNTRTGEMSSMLSTFSERLDNIIRQSDAILGTAAVNSSFPSNTLSSRFTPVETYDNAYSYFVSNFYVRDQRSDNLSPDANNTDPLNLFDIVNSRPVYNAVASDHTYPRNPEGVHLASQMTERRQSLSSTIRFTTMHIQSQARALRQQVENIERIDRTVLEVDQLQLMRRLIVELIRHVSALGGGPSTEHVRSAGTGVSSVRQMMAGTRISDSSPLDYTEDVLTSSRAVWNNEAGGSGDHYVHEDNASQGQEEGVVNADGSGNSTATPNRPARSSGRKTYPPSRMCRSTSSTATTPEAPPASPNSYYQSFSSYSVINANTMGLMTRRLEHLLTQEMGAFSMSRRSRQNNRSTATIDLGEHILALRLHGCVLRLNRLLGRGVGSSTTLRADPTAAVTHDGLNRYGTRHTLSLIIDSMSRHVEELGHSPIPQGSQIHSVLTMSLLLTELMLIVVVESIPYPPGISFTYDRVSMYRTDRLCTEMLYQRIRERPCDYARHLSRSLKLMKLIMRHAQTTLTQTYDSRRNNLIPRYITDRRMLLGSINRCLRTIRRQRGNTTAGVSLDRNQDSTPNSTANSSSFGSAEWYSSVSDLLAHISSTNNDDENTARSPQPSTSQTFQPSSSQNDVSSNNDNTDDDDDDTDTYGIGSSNLYRTSNINLSPSGDQTASSNVSVSPPVTSYSRWNVPLVAVNDVPVSEPTGFAQRLINQRTRFAERVSELRSNPQMGLFRPRFLHPLYASVNPFDADLDDPQREQIYDSDMITTITPNHRIQAWDVSDWSVPNIGSSTRNLVVNECKIHNDASVDIAKDGTILVSLLPSGGYLNVTNRLGIYSLKWETLGQCLYTTSFEQNAVSVSLSPLSRLLVVGLASRIVPSERWIMAKVFKIHQKEEPGDRLPVIRELEQNRDSRINCIRWLPTSGQGLIYATNTGQLVVLT